MSASTCGCSSKAYRRSSGNAAASRPTSPRRPPRPSLEDQAGPEDDFVLESSADELDADRQPLGAPRERKRERRRTSEVEGNRRTRPRPRRVRLITDSGLVRVMVGGDDRCRRAEEDVVAAEECSEVSAQS